MRRMKLKDQFIDVIGTWGGEGDDAVTEYLTTNGYTFKVQHGDKGRNVEWGDDELNAKQKQAKRLVVLGDGLYQQWSCDPGSVLAVGEDGDMNFYDGNYIDENFEDA